MDGLLRIATGLGVRIQGEHGSHRRSRRATSCRCRNSVTLLAFVLLTVVHPAGGMQLPVPLRGAQEVQERDSAESRLILRGADGERLDVWYQGEFVVADDDRSFTSMAPGSYLIVSERPIGDGRHIELRADADGEIDIRYIGALTESPDDSEGPDWLARILPGLLQRTDISAHSRVRRFLDRGGPSAVLEEISNLDSAVAQRAYFLNLFEVADLNESESQLAIAQAGREVSDDRRLVEILAAGAELAARYASSAQAYFEATETVGSDRLQRQALELGISRVVLTIEAVQAAFLAVEAMGSDDDAAAFLSSVPTEAIETAPAAFFHALGTIGSDSEQARVSTHIGALPGLSEDTLVSLLDAAVSGIGDDGEMAGFLVRFAEQHETGGGLGTAWLAAVRSVGSATLREDLLLAARTDER